MRILRFWISLFVLYGHSALCAAALVEKLSAETSADHTRLIFDLNSTLEHRIFTLENPDRLVIDLIDTQSRNSLTNIDLSATPIALVRSAVRNEKDLRVVFDLNHKIKPRSFIEAGNGQSKQRLIIELYDNQARAQQTATYSEPVFQEAKFENNNRDIVIVISPGHGGNDPGAIGVNRLQEKKVTLAISKEVEQLINATPGYRAVMARDADYYIGLRERVEFAHRHSADLFLAIHADAHSNGAAQGATIYALSQRGATSEQAKLLAEKENSSDLIGGAGSVTLNDKDAVLASVLIDLSMTATVATSLEIGDTLINSLGTTIKMRRKNVEQAAFVELKSAGIPSLLIESGYVTNAGDAKNLDSTAWRKRFAGALVEGINHWFYERPPRNTLIAWQKEHGGFAPGSYTVKRGDTLSEIAERFHVSMNEIKQHNQMKSNTVQLGQTLKIPGSGSTASAAYREHTISRGETLSKIAVSYSVPLDLLRETNSLKNDKIRVGQVILIPTT